MKICWDNIENIRLSNNGNFRDSIKGITFHYHDKCNVCGEPYLGTHKGKYCSKECKDKKIFTEETKKKMSKAQKGSKGSKWNGGYKLKNIPTYNVYAPQLEWAEEVRRNSEDPNILEVRCFKCEEWFIPNYNAVSNRLQYLKGNRKWEQHFYCSDECKNSCSIFNKAPDVLMKEDAIRIGSLPWLELKREVQPELRSMVLERDGNQCIKCENTENLQCHHIYPVNIEPLLSVDIDNCVTLCYNCHKEVHQKDGCRYGQLRIEIC